MLNFIYFFIYFIYLDSIISLINLWFITLVTVSYFALMHFLKWKVWEILSYLILALYFVFSLVNFAYFKVFETFIDIKISSLNTVNGSMFNLLKDYFFLIPLELFLLATIIFIMIIIARVHFEHTNKFPSLNFQDTKIQLRSKRRYSTIAIMIIIFGAINFAGVASAQYLINNPQEDWWDIKNQMFDIGFAGHLYTQAASIQDYSNDQQIPLTTNIKSTPDPFTERLNFLNSENFRALTPLEQTKQTYNVLSYLSKKTSPGIQLPTFKKKPNVLVIQLESIGGWAVNNDPSPMPYLKALIEDNISVPDFHANSCETINAEFSTNCSFLPNSFEPVSYSHLENDYQCLPEILSEKHNYDSYFFHANLMDFWRRDILIPAWGFENNYFTPYYNQKAYDKYVFDDAVNTLSKSENPFYAYIVTFTAHSPHNLELVEYHKKANNLNIVPFSGTINPEYSNIEIDEDELRLYYGFLKATDDSLEFLMNKLKNNGLLENTIVIIHNDHRYYNFLSNSVEDFYNYNVNPFVMILPDKQKGIIQNTATHIDISPTVLNLIEEESYKKPNNFLGTSLFSENFPNQAFNKCLGKIYYKNNDVIINGNAKTNQFYFTYEKEPLSENKKQTWRSLIKRFIQTSDTAIFNNQIIE